MDVTFLRALAAAARAFADEIERGFGPDAVPGASLPGTGLRGTGLPAAGSPASMFEVLQSVAAINDGQGRGASDADIRAIARRAGMDPRGVAGYYAAHLLEKRADGTRWVSATGRERLQALGRVVLLDSARST